MSWSLLNSFREDALERNNLGFARFALASLVLVNHCESASHGFPLPFPAVWAFITISGFLITRSMERSSGYAQFAWKRFLRVMPAFVLSLVLVFLLKKTIIDDLIYWATFGLKRQSLAANGALWSLSVEEVLYAFLALCFAVGLFKSRWWVLIVFGAMIALMNQTIAKFSYMEVRAFQPLYLFCMGSLAYLFREKIPWWPPLGIACLVYSFVMPYHNDWFNIWTNYLFMFSTAYGILCLGVYAPPIFHRFEKLGDPSFGMYVYHMPLLWWFFGMGFKSPLKLVLVTYGVVGILGLLSWHLVEKRALKLKNRDWPSIKQMIRNKVRHA